MFMMSTLAIGAYDPAIRKELAEMGALFTGFGGDEKIHHEAIDPNLSYIALLVATDEYGKPFTDLLWKLFKGSDNANDRNYLLRAMASSIDPEIAEAVRGRILSPDLKDNEVSSILYGQMGRVENREAMWQWTQLHMADLLERIPTWQKGRTPAYFDTFCSREKANEIEAVFRPMIDTLESGPRNLANALETIRLCAAFADRHKTVAGEQNGQS
jgi:alanyl aminopeptidase